MRNYFVGVILTHVDTLKPNFSKIRMTIEKPIDVNCPSP